MAQALQAALTVRGDIAGQVARAASGENNLTWFLGLAPAGSPRWVIVVLLEQDDALASYEIAARVRSQLGP